MVTPYGEDDKEKRDYKTIGEKEEKVKEEFLKRCNVYVAELYMTEFMKTVLIKNTFLCTKWLMHFDFTAPKGLKIPPSDEQNIEMCMEKKIKSVG